MHRFQASEEALAPYLRIDVNGQSLSVSVCTYGTNINGDNLAIPRAFLLDSRIRAEERIKPLKEYFDEQELSVPDYRIFDIEESWFGT